MLECSGVWSNFLHLLNPLHITNKEFLKKYSDMDKLSRNKTHNGIHSKPFLSGCGALFAASQLQGNRFYPELRLLSFNFVTAMNSNTVYIVTLIKYQLQFTE